MSREFTLTEFLLLAFVATLTLLTLLMVLPARSYIKKECEGRKCKGNLYEIGKGMRLYVLDFGRSVYYPQSNGSGFLATLYQEKILVERCAYLCTSTPDDNKKTNWNAISGKGDGYGPISYAGRKNKRQGDYPGIFEHFKNATITTIAADDWNDGFYENHENGDLVRFLFLDGHSEYIKSRGANFNNYSYLYDPLAN